MNASATNCAAPITLRASLRSNPHIAGFAVGAGHRFRKRGPSSGRVEGEAFPILNLTETIVPAMVTSVAPIAAPDQIVFVLGNFRGDIWIRDI